MGNPKGFKNLWGFLNVDLKPAAPNDFSPGLFAVSRVSRYFYAPKNNTHEFRKHP